MLPLFKYIPKFASPLFCTLEANEKKQYNDNDDGFKIFIITDLEKKKTQRSVIDIDLFTHNIGMINVTIISYFIGICQCVDKSIKGNVLHSKNDKKNFQSTYRLTR